KRVELARRFSLNLAAPILPLPFPTSGQGGITVHYNADDTVHDVVDPSCTTTYSYFPDGSIQSVVYNYAAIGLKSPQEVDYTHYPDGSRSSLTWKNYGVTAARWSYSYDPSGPPVPYDLRQSIVS